MALGGGTWLFQNKKLPGTYINFISQVRAMTEIADRGYVTMALELDWGKTGEVFTVTAEDFQEKCLAVFGYDYTDPKMQGLRDLFMNTKTAYFYRLANDPIKAQCSLARAKCAGERGNDIKVAVAVNLDEEDKFDVKTYFTVGGVMTLVDEQKGVSAWSEVKDNDYVEWIASGEMQAQAGMPLENGSNGNAVTGVQWAAYLDAIEPYYFNCMGYPGSDKTIKSLLISFVRRMRDDIGAKCQLVLYDAENVDYEGVISIKNAVTDEGAEKGSLVWWTTGAEASCAVNASCTNKIYDGEYTVDTNYTQLQLEAAISSGMLIFHNVAGSSSGELVGHVRLLQDINTFTSFTTLKNEDFSYNQVIRVLDQIAIDIAHLFNSRYLGKEQNDDDGRVALWGDIIALHKEYQRVRAIQNFNPDDVPVPEQGQSKNSVVLTYSVQPTVAMEKLYITCVVA